MALTNQQILDKLLEVQAEFISSGNLMKKNITTPEGSTIFFHSFEELEGWINLYQSKVAADNGNGGYFTRMFIYG